MMGLGEPATGKENFPIPYTPLKPFNQALQGMELGGPGGGMGGGGLQAEAMPGRTVITAEEVTAALTEATNRKGEQATMKLKGKVYLMGEIAERGWTDGAIEIGITIKSDQQIITNALPQWASQNLLRFRMLPANSIPEGAVPISGASAQPEPVLAR
jgi:hypothetical protein